MPLLDDLDPSPPPKLTDLDPGGGLLNDLDPLVDERKARNARVRADQQQVGLAHTPASDSAAARQQQLATGKAFDAAHPIDPVTAARMRGEPVMGAYEKPNPIVTYGKALGLGVAKNLTKLNLALRLNAPFERSDSGGQSDEDYLKSVLDSFETAPGAHPLPGREAAAAIDSAPGWSPDGGANILPSARTAGDVVGQAPTMAMAAIPFVGPEAFALTSGEEVRQDYVRAGAEPMEALARGAAAALGGELGFRAVPALRPELAKLSPVQDVAPAAAAGGKGSFTGRLAEGGAMGEAMDLTTPQDDPSKPRDLTAAGGMAVLAAGGGRLRGPVHYKNALEKVIAEGEQTHAAEPVLGDLDPAAETQTDLRPVMQGPETQEFKVFQKGEAPGDVLERPDTPEERAVDLAASQQKLDAIKRIRATGEPVVGGTETREIDPAAVKTAIDTEDAVKTAVEGAPDQLMHRSPPPVEETRQGDTQDAISTRPEGFSVFPKEEPDHITHMTREIGHGERAYQDALSDNVKATREKREAIANRRRTFTPEELAAARDEFNAKYPEVAFAKPGDELAGHESPLAPPEEKHAEPAQPAPAREEAPAASPEPEAAGSEAPKASVANDLAGGGFRRRGAEPSDVPTGRVSINGREGTVIPGAPAGHTRVRFENGKQAVVPDEALEQPKAGNSQVDTPPKSTPAPDTDRGGVAHALRAESPEGRTAEKKDRRQGPNLYEGKSRAEVQSTARRRAQDAREEIIANIRDRHQARENFRDEGERAEAQHVVANEIEAAIKSRDPGKLADALTLARQERAVASLAGATLAHGVRQSREMKPHERHQFAQARAAEAHGNGGLARKIADLEHERDALREKLGAHAPTTDGTKPPKAASKPFTPNQRRSKLTRKKAALNEEFKALAKALAKNFTGKGPSNALGGRVLDLIYQMLENRVKHGAVSFADAVLAISDQVLVVRHNADAHTAMDHAWDRIMERHPEAEAPEGSAAEIIENDPRNSLEKRLERMDNYYKKLEEHYQSYHDQLAAMTPEQRVEFLQGEAANAELPPELQKLREEGAARLKTLREQIKAIDGSKGKGPSLQEQIDEEGRRLGNLHGKIDAERGRLATMTPEELMAEAQKKRAAKQVAPEIAKIREEAAQRRAEIRKQLSALENPDRMYPEGATDVPLPPELERHQKNLDRIERKLRAMRTEDASRFQKISDAMAKRGFPLDDPDAAWLKDPTLMAPYLSALESVTKNGLGPVLAEWYRAALHTSGHILNMKVATDIVQFTATEIERLGSGVPKETAAAWKGLMPGIAEGFKLALQSLKYERDRFRDVHEGGGEASDLTHGKHGVTATPGLVGRGVRLVAGLTPVAAINAFASAVYARMEVGAQAYRRARASGEKDIAGFIQKEIADLDSESWAAASRIAAHKTFTEPNPISRGLNRLKNTDTGTPMLDIPVKVAAHILFPFTTIPANVLKQFALERTPVLQTIGTLHRYIQHAHGKNPDFRLSQEVSQHVLTWAITLGLAQVIDSEDGFGHKRITGFAEKRNPASILFNGHYYSYAKLGPVAHGIGATVDLLHAIMHKRSAGDAVEAMKHHVTEEAYLRSVADLIDAFEDPNHAARYAANVTTSFVPAVAKQIRHGLEDDVENLTDRHDKDFGTAYKEDVRRNLGIGEIPFRYDIWGEPLQKDGFDGRPTTTFLWRVFSPMRLGDKVSEQKKLDYLIADWNEKHPGESDQIAIRPPTRTVREGQPYPDGEGGQLGGKTYHLSEKQLEEALRTGGAAAKRALEKQLGSKEHLTPQDAKVLTQTYDTFINGTKKLIAVRDDDGLDQKFRDIAAKAAKALAEPAP